MQDTPAKKQSTEFTEAVQHRIAALRNSVAFQNYEDVRNHVLRMKDLEAQRSETVLKPSAYWREAQKFQYMLDAHPLIIDKLRHHSYHVTGLRVYDYRSNKDSVRELLAEKLEVLVKWVATTSWFQSHVIWVDSGSRLKGSCTTSTH